MRQDGNSVQTCEISVSRAFETSCHKIVRCGSVSHDSHANLTDFFHKNTDLFYSVDGDCVTGVSVVLGDDIIIVNTLLDQVRRENFQPLSTLPQQIKKRLK